MLSWGILHPPAANNDGYNPLHLAAEEGDILIVHYFLQKGMYQRSHQTSLDQTPLHLAAKNNHYAVVNLLLRFGSQNSSFINYRDKTGKTAFELTNDSKIKALLQRGIADSSHKFDYEKIKGLTSEQLCAYISVKLKEGADIDERNEDGMACLHEAVFDNRLDIVRQLVEFANADVNLRDKDKKRPPHLDKHGYTPLHLAGNLKIAEYLVSWGADKESVAFHTDTPKMSRSLRNAECFF